MPGLPVPCHVTRRDQSQPADEMHLSTRRVFARVQRGRKAHPALQQLRNITFHTTTDRDVICYSKWDGDDRIIVVCLLDPHNQHESDVYLDMDGLGLRPDDVIDVHDELCGAEWTWGSNAFVRLTPANPAHVLHVRGVRH
mgnify:CR=1 FL=1